MIHLNYFMWCKSTDIIASNSDSPLRLLSEQLANIKLRRYYITSSSVGQQQGDIRYIQLNSALVDMDSTWRTIFMPDMIFLSLSITTFYRKSFRFDSQVFIFNIFS